MTLPMDPNSNQKPIEYSPHQNEDVRSSWYFRNVRPMIRTTGYILSETGGPIMTAGLIHGFGSHISKDYFKLVSRYPSGAGIFLTGLALKFFGNSLVQNYTTRSLSSPTNKTIEFEVDSSKKND